MVKTTVTIYDDTGPNGPHSWLSVGKKTAGRYPIGGIWLSPSEFHSPDNGHIATSSEEIWLDDCKYDIHKFQSCVASKAVDGASGGLYSLPFSNCYTWVFSAIDDHSTRPYRNLSNAPSTNKANIALVQKINITLLIIARWTFHEMDL